jgi:hypothetical protein
MIEVRLVTGQTVHFEGDPNRLKELFPKVKQARLQNEWVTIESSQGVAMCYFPATSIAFIGIVSPVRAKDIREESGRNTTLRIVPGDESKN